MTDVERTEGLIGRWQGTYRPDNGNEESYYVIERREDGSFVKASIDLVHDEKKYSATDLEGRWRVEDDELVEESDFEGENRYKILLIDENEFHSQWLDAGHPDPYVFEEERTDLPDLPDPPEDYEEW